jgi:hypothetical protein
MHPKPKPATYVDAVGVIHNARLLSDEPDAQGKHLLLVCFTKAGRFEVLRARRTTHPEPGAFYLPIPPS